MESIIETEILMKEETQIIEPLDIPELVRSSNEEPETQVIQNSDYLYKKSIDWVNNIEYVEPNQYEIEMLHGTKKPKELIEDEGVEEIVLKSEEEIKKQKTKDLLLIFKVVSLNRLGYYPIMNTSELQSPELKSFLDVMNSLIDDYHNGLEVPITDEFNKICANKIFKNGQDVSIYPVYTKH